MNDSEKGFKAQLFNYHGLKMMPLDETYYGDKRENNLEDNAFNLPKFFNYAEKVVDDMDFTLSDQFPEMLKKRDKFVGNFIKNEENILIDEWIKSVINDNYDNDDDNVERFIKTAIIYPTECSLNTLNMIKNGPYVFSEYTDRNPNDSDVSWSGFNLEYVIGKRQSPIEQAILMFAIVETMTAKDFDLSAIDLFVSERMKKNTEVNDTFSIEYVNIVFDSYARQLHNKIISGIDLINITRMVNLYIDYANVFNFIPWTKINENVVVNNDRKDNVGCSLLSSEMINKIIDIDSFVVIKTEGYKLWGFDFKSNQKIHLHKTDYSHSSMDQYLKEELRYSELMSQFVKTIPPRKYIISEKRPEELLNRESNNKRKHDYLLLDENDDKSDNKELNKIALRAKEHEIRMATLKEKKLMRSEIAEQSRSLAELRRKLYVTQHEAKLAENNKRATERVRDKKDKLMREITQSELKHDEMQTRMIEFFEKNLQKLIDKKYASEAVDEKQKRDIIIATTQGIDKSNESIQKLMRKLMSATDRMTEGKIGKELDENGLLSSNALELLGSHIESVDSLMKTINEISNNLCLDQTKETDSNEATKIKHLINAMENKVETIIFKNLANLDKDMHNAQQSVEEIYKRIDASLSEEEQTSIVGEETINYEREMDDYSLDLQEEIFGGMDVDENGAISMNKDSQLREMKSILNTCKGNYSVKFIDKNVAKIVNVMRKRFKKNIAVLRAVNEDSKKISTLYSDACKDKNVYKLKLESTNALLSDAKVVNGLISKALHSATQASKQQMSGIKKKLEELIERVKKKEAKDIERVEHLKNNVERAIADIMEIGGDTNREIQKIKSMWSSIDIEEFNRNMFSKGLSDQILEKKTMYADMMNQLETKNRQAQERIQKQIEAIEHSQTDDVIDNVRNLNEGEHQSSSFSTNTPHLSTNTSSSPPPTSSSLSRTNENDKIEAIDALREECIKQNKKRKRYAIEAINKSNKVYDKFIKLQQSSWSNLNGIKCGNVDEEPDRYELDGIFRKAKLDDSFNKENVNYVRDELKEKWNLLANEKFVNAKYVTPTGVTVSVKSIKNTFLTYVFPCLRILYGEKAVMDHNMEAILKSETQTSLDALKSVLMNKKVWDRIQARVIHEQRQRGGIF